MLLQFKSLSSDSGNLYKQLVNYFMKYLTQYFSDLNEVSQFSDAFSGLRTRDIN